MVQDLTCCLESKVSILYFMRRTADNNNNNVYFKSLSYTNVLFKLEMNAQQNKIF
jgi:hypothetical protein